MEFIIFGSGSGLPVLDKGLSSIYVEHQGKKLLFDCGEGSSYHLLRHELCQNEIDAIIISHYHPDHATGLLMLIQMLYLQQRSKRLQVFLPERVADFEAILQFHYTFKQRWPFELHLHPMEELPHIYPEVQIHLTDHLEGYKDIIQELGLPNQMKSWAFRVDNWVYSSDIETTDCLAPILQDLDTLVVDALHPKLEQILKLKEYRIRQIILNHGLSPELDEWLQNNEHGNFIVAEENVPYHI